MGRLIKKTRKHQKKSLVKGGKKKRGGSKKVIQKKKRVSRKGRMLGGNVTRLHQACMYGNLEEAKKLIAEGAAINARDFSQQTPLHYAGMYGGLEITKELIKAGADINARNIENETPLHFAVTEDNIKVAEELIKAGADVNAKDNHGNTPLHHRRFSAELFHTHDIAETLIKNGADINIQNKEGEIPALPAAMTELFNRLWRSNDIVAAMHIGNMDAFQTLLNDDTYDVNEKLTGGETILHVAARLNRNVNRMEYVDLILKSGRVDVDAKTNDSKTALMIANERGDVELVHSLLGVSKKQR